MTKPLSLEECLGHGPLLPLKANVHELRLVLGLGGLYFDLDLDSEDLTWTGKENWKRKTRVKSRRSNMLVVDD